MGKNAVSWVAVLLVAGRLLAGCSEDGTSVPDGTIDHSGDRADGTVEADADEDTDGPADLPVDADEDADADSSTDSVPDALPDADVVPDSPPDADAVPDILPDADADVSGCTDASCAAACADHGYPVGTCAGDLCICDWGADADADVPDSASEVDADTDADAGADADADADADAGPCGPAACPTDPVDSRMGEPCLDDLDCVAGAQCWTERVDVFGAQLYVSWAGGYCVDWGFGTMGCDPDVAGSCPAGSTCLYLGEDSTGRVAHGCLDACSPASSAGVPWTSNCDCRDGYECTLTSGLCLPGCSNDRVCCEIWHDGEGGTNDGIRQTAEVRLLPSTECLDACNDCTYACDRLGCPSGACYPGGPCEHDSDCPALGRCIDEWSYGAGYPGGLCVQDACNLLGRECPIGAGCGNMRSTADPYFTCVVPCTPGTDPGDPGWPCRDASPTGPSADDQACWPVDSSFWDDATTETGFCWPGGNYAGGTRAIGRTCTSDAVCTSPHGLGYCDLTLGTTSWCTAECDRRLAAAGMCESGAPGTTATGACTWGACLAACGTPGGTLGANGCVEPNMACYALSEFPPETYVDAARTAPSGLCYPACRTTADCTYLWGAGTCNTLTGVCS